MSVGIGWSPVVPERRQRQSDSDWVRDYERRGLAARLRPLNRVLAAEAESQNRGLSDQLTRMAGGGRASRPRVRAEDERLLREYYREHSEGAAVVARAERRSRGAVISRSTAAGSYAAPLECRHCRDCGFTPEQSRSVHAKWDVLTAAGHQTYDPRGAR